MKLPRRISEDTVFKNDKRYILASNMVIDKDVTRTFEAGCEIEVFEGSDSYYDTIINSPQIINYGNLLFKGTKESRIKIAPSEKFEFEFCRWYMVGKGNTVFNYCNVTNMWTGGDGNIDLFENSEWIVNGSKEDYYNGGLSSSSPINSCLNIHDFVNSTLKGKDLVHIPYYRFDNFLNSSMQVLKSKPFEYGYPGLFNVEIANSCVNSIFVQQKEFDMNMGSNGDYDPMFITLKAGVTKFDNNTFVNEYDESEIPLAKSIRIYVEDGCVSDWHGNNFTGMYNI